MFLHLVRSWCQAVSCVHYGRLVLAMGSVLLAWSVLYLVFSGLGLLVRRSCGLRIVRAEDWLTAFWVGWASGIFILQVWHLQFRVDWRILALISLLGMVGLLWSRGDLRLLVKGWLPPNWLFCLLLAVAATLLANHAIGPPHYYDAGLYHFPAISWAKSYPIVPGLGNLHNRLAYNSSHFLYVAMLDVGPWAQRAHHLANGLLLSVLLMQSLSSAFRLRRDGRHVMVWHLFNILLGVPALKLALSTYEISSPVSDTPVFVLGCVLSSQLLWLLVNKEYPRREAAYLVLCMSILAAVGVTVKMSIVVFGGTACLVAAGVWLWRNRGPGRAEPGGAVRRAAACGAVVLVVWMVRGMILSGYAAYPSTLVSAPVEWRIPRESAVDDANWIRSWARLPEVHWRQVLGKWDWLRPWADDILKQHYFDIVIPSALALISLICTVSWRVTRGPERMGQSGGWLALLPALASLVFWFLTAPDPRYARAGFWVVGAGATSLALSGVALEMGRVLCIASLVSVALLLIPDWNWGIRHLIIGPGRDQGFWPTSRVDLKTFVTHSGLVVYVPREGELCWEAPVPCAPHPRASLSLRRAGDVGGGFREEAGGK